MNHYRSIPSVDHLLNLPDMAPLLEEYGHAWCVSAIRSVLDQLRQPTKDSAVAPDNRTILQEVETVLNKEAELTLRSVINATGVILHTNLGRAPLSESALEAIREIGGGYSSIEYDLKKGNRGKRDIHAADLLSKLTGAEGALVVNNNAGAVMLTLAALANRKKVAISRSQLVEIGGGFRIPEVMRLSGAKLLEIGTTNRTHLKDFEEAVEDGASLFLLAHQSNFKIIGFTTMPLLTEISTLAKANSLPVVYDLGSGALLDVNEFGLENELTVQQALKEGADLVCFSGDKLLGGPQAGLIVGNADLIAKIRRHPFYRALRADKLCLAALNATLLEYLKGKAEEEVPVIAMLSQKPEKLKERASQWQTYLGTGEVIESKSTIGGGSLPEQELQTWCLAITPSSAKRFTSRLRQFNPPVIARIENEQVLLDPRTVFPKDEEILLSHLSNALTED